MSEYVIEIPDDCFLDSDTERTHYYPDERDSAMAITPIVRCRDCVYCHKREWNSGLFYYTCSYFDSEYAEVELDGFCAWAVRREVDA